MLIKLFQFSHKSSMIFFVESSADVIETLEQQLQRRIFYTGKEHQGI